MTRSVEIPEEAVAAAARVFFGGAYGSVGDEGNKVLHEGAREALEAALPYLAPAEPPVIDREALRELVQAWKVGPHRPDTSKVERDNYRRRFVDAVMELARPEAEVKAEALRWAR